MCDMNTNTKSSILQTKRNIFPKNAMNKYSPYTVHPPASAAGMSKHSSFSSTTSATSTLSSTSSLRSFSMGDPHSPIDLSKHLPWVKEKYCTGGGSGSSLLEELPARTAAAAEPVDLDILNKLELSDAVAPNNQDVPTGKRLIMRRSSRKHAEDSFRNVPLKSILRQSSFSNTSHCMEGVQNKNSLQDDEEGVLCEGFNRSKGCPSRSKSCTFPRESGTPGKSNRIRSKSMSNLYKVSFNNRVNVLEFKRTKEEVNETDLNGWFSSEELEEFKNNAMKEIRQFRARKAKLMAQPKGGHSYSGVDCAQLLHEIRDILVVDCHDIFLKLFAHSLVQLMPHVNVVTARSAMEAMSRIEVSKLSSSNPSVHGYDVIIVEERLHRVSSRGPLHKDPNHCISRSPAAVNELFQINNAQTHAGEISGSNLISHLNEVKRHDVNKRETLIIGVSAYLHNDEKKLKDAGSDLLWSKPPPTMDTLLRNKILQAIVLKRSNQKI